MRSIKASFLLALSKKMPTERFPNGFGRLVNLVLLGEVLIVGIISYETLKEGIPPSRGIYRDFD